MDKKLPSVHELFVADKDTSLKLISVEDLKDKHKVFIEESNTLYECVFEKSKASFESVINCYGADGYSKAVFSVTDPSIKVYDRENSLIIVDYSFIEERLYANMPKEMREQVFKNSLSPLDEDDKEDEE